MRNTWVCIDRMFHGELRRRRWVGLLLSSMLMVAEEHEDEGECADLEPFFYRSTTRWSRGGGGWARDAWCGESRRPRARWSAAFGRRTPTRPSLIVSSTLIPKLVKLIPVRRLQHVRPRRGVYVHRKFFCLDSLPIVNYLIQSSS
jgi:hypothetical protein